MSTARRWLRTALVLPVLLALGLTAGGTARASDDALPNSLRVPTITISNFAFVGDLTVFAGSFVIVHNADTAPHTLTAVDGSFTTPVIEGGGSAVFRAPATPGNYAITCTIHPRMSGVLRVGVPPAAHPVITIRGFQFTGDLTVPPGSTVTVTNADAAPHNVTAVDGSFATITLQQGQSATFTAPKAPGDYPIKCTIHARMAGTVTVGFIVVPAPLPAPAQPAMATGHHH
jgi:plastocyanin